MEDQGILSKVQDLTDVELALLLCLVANQHCIIETTEEALDKLEDEILLVCTTPIICHPCGWLTGTV